MTAKKPRDLSTGMQQNTRTVDAGAVAGTNYDAYSLYWGDIHCHTSHSFDAQIATRRRTQPPEDALLFGRDVAKLDFVAITDHAEFLSKKKWRDTQLQCNRFNEPHDFVAFIGFELTSTVGPAAGHKHVIFKTDHVIEKPLNSPLGLFGLVTPYQLWDALKPYETITISHHPAVMRTNWDYVNESMMPLVEIFSKWGSSEREGAEEPVRRYFFPENTVEKALLRWVSTGNKGYRLGIIAGTDDHGGRPGSVEEIPENAWYHWATTGGLAAVYAVSKTRADIFDALAAKRTYGTSGPRIQLTFALDADGSVALMGESLSVTTGTQVTLAAEAAGDTAPISMIELIKNGEIVRQVSGAQLIFADVVTERSYYRVVAYQDLTMRWDNYTRIHRRKARYVQDRERAWSSPIFVEVC